MKRIKQIAVKSEQGKLLAWFAPNFIGSTEKQLLEKAEKIAREQGGKVEISR